MAFSANEAALEGFRIVRREPLTFAVWTIGVLVFGVGFLALLMPMMAPMMALSSPGTLGARPDPALAAQILPVMGRLYAIMIPMLLIYMAVANAAVYRAVLRPDETRFGRIRLGADELRLLGVSILLGLLYIAVSVGAVIVCMIVAALAALAFRSQIALAMGVSILVAYLIVFGLMIWMGVRLSLAAPMTFAERRIVVFRSWSLTKGRFWGLLGCYLLVFAMLVGLYMAMMCLYGAASLVATGGSLTRAGAFMLRPDMTSLQAYLTPPRIAYMVLVAPLSALILAVSAAPPAAAYRALVADRASA